MTLKYTRIAQAIGPELESLGFRRKGLWFSYQAPTGYEVRVELRRSPLDHEHYTFVVHAWIYPDAAHIEKNEYVYDKRFLDHGGPADYPMDELPFARDLEEFIVRADDSEDQARIAHELAAQLSEWVDAANRGTVEHLQ